MLSKFYFLSLLTLLWVTLSINCCKLKGRSFMMAQTKVLLLACGSFNPPTNMHLRMFEIARDHLQRLGQHKVIGGVISPVHDGYGKKDLVSSANRCTMLRLALKNNEWVKLSDWECQQSDWSRTRQVLQYHQNQLNSALNANHNSPHKRQKREIERDVVDDVQHETNIWVPSELIRHADGGPVQVMLLCGADMLESFGKPGLWAQDDVETIVEQHGLVVITREGTNPYKFIYESDVLTKHMSKIIIVTEWIANEVSSTKIRRAVRRGESIKYLVPDAVAEYIQSYQLYVETSSTTPNHKMAEFLGAEFGTFGGSSKFQGRVSENELVRNEENMKRSLLGSSALLPKSTSRDCLDGPKDLVKILPRRRKCKK